MRFVRTIYPYAIALVLVVASLELTLSLREHITSTPAPFFAAVAIASWYGFGPGLLVTVASALLLDYYVVPPLYHIDFDIDHIVRLAVFACVSLLISWMSHSLQKARRRAEERADEAHREIAERKRIEAERLELLRRERDARRQAEAAQQRLAFVADAGRVVNASLDVRATLEGVGQMAVPALADWAIVFIERPDGALQRASVNGPPGSEPLVTALRARGPSARLKETNVWRRLAQGERLLFADVTDDVLRAMAEDEEHLSLLTRLRPVAIMLVPLQAHGQVFGAISFISTTAGRTFSNEDLAMAEEVAGRAAVALSNAQLYEQAQQANRIKDEFLATVSHELRTPLHAILGWSRLLRGASLSEDASVRALESIERNANAQAQLVGDILDVSRIVTGKLKLDVRPVVLTSIVEAALDSVRPSAHGKGIELEARVTDPRLVLIADADRLQQIVWNLVSNAIKFTPPGGRVEVETRRAGDEAEIRVSDTGIGIDPAFLPHVFDRFRQADSSTTRVHGGLGLGLAIVRHLAELHGGRAIAESQGPGRGATFRVLLPALAPARQPRATRPRMVRLPAAVLHGVRILAVDDEADARELIVASVERYGAEARTAASTREALEMMDEECPDVLIGDIGMPDEDGFALIAKVRSRAPERGGQVPAVALTAYARREDRDRTLQAGFQVHLSKPISDAELVSAIATLLGRAGVRS